MAAAVEGGDGGVGGEGRWVKEEKDQERRGVVGEKERRIGREIMRGRGLREREKNGDRVRWHHRRTVLRTGGDALEGYHHRVVL